MDMQDMKTYSDRVISMVKQPRCRRWTRGVVARAGVVHAIAVYRNTRCKKLKRVITRNPHQNGIDVHGLCLSVHITD